MTSIKKRIVGVLRQEETVQLLREIREGIANQASSETLQVLREIRAGLENQSALLNDKLSTLTEELGKNPSQSEQTASPSGQQYDIQPITDIPFPSTDLSQDNPISSLIESAEYRKAVRNFENNPAAARSSLSPDSQALLYCLMRIAKPAGVIEIGTFMASTTEAMARALHANGAGIVHTIDPFAGDIVPSVIAAWPPELQARAQFHCKNSMQFFAETADQGMAVDLVLVDGNHDYPFALFDIECAARMANRGAFIVIGNISQAGPFLAAKDFLAKNPSWREHGSALADSSSNLAFDRHRVTITNTDFCILRAPSGTMFDSRPMTPGQQPWTGRELTGILLRLAHEATGTLHVQYVVRTFGNPHKETTIQRSVKFAGLANEVTIPMRFSFNADDAMVRKTVEPWFVWEGDTSLELVGPPSIY